jgi:hypothetical protein
LAAEANRALLCVNEGSTIQLNLLPN